MTRPLRVLLVDDSEAVRFTMGAIMELAGHQVITASSLAEARARLGEAAFDIAVVDVHLDDGLGSELIPEIRRRMPGAAIALLSGAAVLGEVGADVVLEKGGDPETLVRRVEHLACGTSPPV